MKLEKAIRLKELEGDEFLHADPDELDEADRLSIEALKYIRYRDNCPGVNTRLLLPGETEE